MRHTVSFCFLLMLLLAATCGYAEPQFMEISHSTIKGFPLVDWIFNVDVCCGYVGTISSEKGLFQLWAEDGNIIFERRPGPDCLGFLSVSMSNTPGLILLMEFIEEEEHTAVVLNYEGDTVAGPFSTDNVVAVSPSARFLYSVNDPGNGSAHAAVYDSAGNKLFSDRTAGAWDIVALNDSLLLYRNRDHIQVREAPSLVVQAEWDVSRGDPSDYQVSALSPDGKWYTYSQRISVIVCDLENRKNFYIPVNEGRLFCPIYDLAISNDGTYLILFAEIARDPDVIVYKRDGNEFRRYGQADNVAANMLPWPQKRSFFVNDSICILGWGRSGRGGTRFYSYICDLALSKDSVKGVMLEGLATHEPVAPDGSPRFRLTQLDSSSATTRVLQLIPGGSTTPSVR